MIRAARITIAGNIPFEDVTILEPHEATNAGVKNYFEDAQILIKSKDGLFILPKYRISLIHLSRKARAPKGMCTKFKRVSLSGNMTYCPAYVVHPGRHTEIGIPNIFKSYEQFNFFCSEGLFVTSDFNVMLMEL